MKALNLVLLCGYLITVNVISDNQSPSIYEHVINKDNLPKYAFINQTHYHPNGNRSKLNWQNSDNFCDSLYISPLFSDNMILQREPSQSVIFGFGTPNATVKLTLSNSQSNYNKSFTTTISDYANKYNNLGLGECSWYIILPSISGTINQENTYDISILCTNGCTNWLNNDSIKLTGIQFGDIWVCSGQSNMNLGVEHTFSWYNTSINQTTQNYNIKVLKLPTTMSLTPTDSRNWIGDNTVYWQPALYSNLTQLQFSAVCYYFARNLIDFWQKNNLDIIPIGLIHSCWGGTIIETWMSKEDQNPCDYRTCENYDGHTTCGIYYPLTPCNESKITSVNEQPSSAYNGMLLPLTNITIKGAIWYQGENNGPNPGDWLKNQGYACMLPRLLYNWRREWINNNYANTYLKINPNNIPFGIVSLHPWCGEEASNCYAQRNYSDISKTSNPTWYNLAWLRWAQIGSIGRLPNWIMPNSFIAMSYDLADTGALPPPQYYEGALHPRNKYTLGKRLSLSALAIAYNNDTIPYIGPVLSFCDVDYDSKQLNLQFDTVLLRNENIIMKNNYGFEVQTNNSFGGWYDVNITNIYSSNDLILDLIPVLGGESKFGLNNNNPLSNTEYNKIIGLRYAWRDVPCCNVTDWYAGKPNPVCPEANCAIYTKNSDLPLIPFIYSINQKGECDIPVQYD